MTERKPVVIAAPWQTLRRYTSARIALGRAGQSMPTAAHLDFQLAHAQARDAVHLSFDVAAVAAALEAQGLATLQLRSAAADRSIYLQRPDLGRRLDETSCQLLLKRRNERPAGERFDIGFVVADGLSALAVQRHAAALLAAIGARLAADTQPWRVAPVALVAQGRVAVGDETGELLDANAVVVLIGERPGLSSPDSLGIYLSWSPRPGLSDAERNCISNVRPEGLSIDAAAAKLHYLLTESRRRQLSGVALKDETDAAPASLGSTAGANFLLEPPA